MSSSVIAVDFGCSFTKIAVRKGYDSDSELHRGNDLMTGRADFLIPTVVALNTIDGRMAFGAMAYNLTETERIRIFRNWKSHLFFPSAPSQKTKALRKFWRRGSSSWSCPDHMHSMSLGFFAWLKREFLDPLEAEIGDGVPQVRVCIPASAFRPNCSGLNSEAFIGLLREAGWGYSRLSCESEPRANIIGCLSKGRNVLIYAETEDKSKLKCGPAYSQVFEYSGMAEALARTFDKYTILAVDIGALTTDFAVMKFDGAGSRATLSEESVRLGVCHLEDRIRDKILKPSGLITRLKLLSAYKAEVMYRELLAGNEFEIGEIKKGSDYSREAINIEISIFSLEVVEALKKFLGSAGLDQIDEVILTGGGMNLEEVSRLVTEFLLSRKAKCLHAVLRAGRVSVESYFHLTDTLTRGGSAIGAASIVLDSR